MMNERENTGVVEDFYKPLVEALNEIGEGFFIADGDGHILYASEACSRISGYSIEELLALPSLYDLLVVSQQKGGNLLSKLLRKRLVDRYEGAMVQKSGRRVDVEVTVKPFREDGSSRRVILVRDTTERKRAEETLRRQNEYLDTLHETSLALMNRLELPDLLEAIVARAGALVDTPHGYIFLVEPGGTELEMRVGMGVFAKYAGSRIKPGECVSGQVWESGQPLVVDDYRTWQGRLPQFSQDDFRAVAGVPLKSGSEVVGVIGLSRLEEGRTFGNGEMELLSRFAGLASVALDNARLYTRAQQELAERKRAEEALKESEARFRTIFEESATGISIANLDRRFLETNPAYQQMLGYSEEELYGKPIAEISHPDDVPTDTELNKELLAGSLESYRREKRYVRKDGGLIWVRSTVSVVRNAEGEPQFLIGMVEDITERKEAEEALKRSEERFRSLIQNASDVVMILGPDGTIHYGSPAVERVLGYRPEELVEENAFDYVYPDDRKRTWRSFSRVIENTGGLLPPIELRFRHKDGSWRYIEAVGNNLVDNPSVGGVVVNCRDVTRRRRAEEALRESEERFRSAFDNVATGMSLADPDGRYLRVNRALCEMLGYSEEELLSTTFQEITHPDDVEVSVDRVQRLLRGEVSSYQLEKRYLHAEGHPVWASLSVSVVRDAEDRPLYLIAQRQDITERKEAEKERALLAAIVESSNDAIISNTLDGIITSWNPGAERLYGYSADEVIGKKHISILFPPERKNELRRVLEGTGREGEINSYETVRMARDGRRIHMSITASPIKDSSGNIIGTSGVLRDITGRKRVENALRESEERFRQLFEQSVEALIVHDEEGKIIDCNEETCRSLGYTREELLALSVRDIANGLLSEEEKREREKRGGTLWQRIVAGEPVTPAVVHFGEHKRKDGTTFPIEVRVGGVDYGGKRMILASVRDITERKALEEELAHQAFHDSLTGLPNRALFMNRLEHALARAGRRKDSVAIVFLDLDNFKVINDSLGHEVGDRLLVAAVERLQPCLRPGDTIARLGGDEFTILLEHIGSVSEATWVVERIIEALQAPFTIGGQELFVTSSIGIALSDSGRNRPVDLLRNADLALYRAKGNGKARYEIFDPSMNTRALERLKLGNDLRRALERGEFRVYYQPKVQLMTDKIIGVEALVRWEHPERGLVLPAEFTPIAEETGLILPIGQWVLEEACNQARAWQERYPGDPPLMMCVNFSARQLQDPQMVQDIVRMLRENKLDSRGLCLEITESVLMEDAPHTITTLRKLKGLGVRLAIDDFGTGYSSLSYLKRFPVDYLKIDRSFINGLKEDPKDTGVVSGIIALAHTLEMQTIAEGVETAGQLRVLQELGCDLAQGNYFEEPLSSEAASAFLADIIRR